MAEKLNIANILTFSRIIFGFIFLSLFILIRSGENYPLKLIIIDGTSLIIFIIAIITDGLDGYFARKNDKVTDFGKHFDPLSDSIFFIVVFISFFIIGLMPWYFLSIIILREGFMHIFLRPYIKSKGASLPANKFGKIKTIFQSTFSIMIITFLTFRDVLLFLNIKKTFIDNITYFISLSSFIFFSIIVLLSIFSLSTYLSELKNYTAKKI